MKNLNIKYLGLVTCLFLFVGCEYEGIDPITSVDPGQDEASPVITISNPPEGMVINEATELSSLEINLKVEDDIELQEIVVQVNGENVATYTEFTDYRIALKKFMYEGITFGEHTVTVTATDMDGNVTSKTVNFKKEPPYSPKYENEVFYMGFEGAYMDLLSLTTAQQTGTPGFSENSYEGARSYKGANGAYLSIPLPELGNDFTVAFWYNLNTSADRAGILTATDDSDRNQGFRFFREPAPGDATKQVFKLNVGTETGDIWNDGGTIPAADSDWMHIAFTFTSEGTVIYFDGVPVRSTELSNAQVDWTGVDNLVIGSGLNFEGWGHNSDPSLIDELRLFDVALTAEEIDEMVNPDGGPLSLYLPFDGDYKDVVSDRTITVVGTPGFAGESVEGTNAYAGATGSYLTFPSTGLLEDEFSTTFWYKVNADPNRAGIITVSAVNANGPNLNNLNYGFQLFREGDAASQRIKASVGTGEGNSWNDGGLINVTAGEWVHVAFTISETESKIYLNGVLQNTGTVTGGVDWTGADLISVMSGAPRFTEWNHLSDRSYIDELRFYNVVLSQEEIQAAIAE